MMEKMMEKIRMVLVCLFAVATVAVARPGEGIRAGNVLVRPFVNVDVTHAGNPLGQPKGEERNDVFTDVNPGISASASGEALLLEGFLWSRFRRYDKFDSEDRDDISQQIRLQLGRKDSWQLTLHERYGRVSDYDVAAPAVSGPSAGAPALSAVDATDAPPLAAVERSARSNRDLLDAGIGVGGPLGVSTAISVRYDYGRIDYEDANLFDSQEHKAAVKMARKATDKSDAIVILEYILMDNDSLSDPADFYAVRAGWRWKGTDKSRLEASIGYFGFQRGGSDVDSERDGVSYGVTWVWTVMPKVTLILGGRSDMQLAAETPESSKLVNSASTVVQYTPTDRLALAAILGYRNEDYTEGDRTADQYHARIRCSYQLQKWLNIYGEAWQDETRSRSQGDTTEMRATIGLKAMY